MMEEEKGIKEIRDLLAKNCKACGARDYCEECDRKEVFADLIYKAGYRKVADGKEAIKAIYERAKESVEIRIDYVKDKISDTLNTYNRKLNEYKEELDELRQSLDDLAKEYENELKK